MSVPEPILHGGDTQTLLTTEVKGDKCQGLKPTYFREQLHRIGLALKELHSSDVRLGEVKSLEDHINELVSPSPDILAAKMPQHAELINESLKILRSSAKSWSKPVSTAWHRDFHLRQLFNEGARIAVVDWDLSAQGDPAFDVGYFITYLKNHFSEGEAKFGIESFLDGYNPSSDVLARLPTYEQFNYLRRACRRLRLQDENWEQSLNQMLHRLNSNLEKTTGFVI